MFENEVCGKNDQRTNNFAVKNHMILIFRI